MHKKIYLFGASGKMGRCVRELTPVVQRPEEADALLDFSAASALESNLAAALSAQKPFVIGTTGHPAGFQESLRKAGQDIPVFYAANFSLGLALTHETLKWLKGKLPKRCALKMEETHHKSKKDAPSGTALLLAKSLGIDEVEAHRVDGTVFAHEVQFAFGDEVIRVKHEAFSRKVFAEGALLAVDFVCKKTPGLYGMEDLIRERG